VKSVGRSRRLAVINCVSNTTAAPARTSNRPRRGALSGRLTVGEYVGQRAAKAAQAVRRAGLRPGLNRSFGCEVELVGQVIAQEPSSGCELARNSLVTLYVAAPGAAPDQEESDAAAAELEQPQDGPVLCEVQAPRVQPRVRRRRKPGRAGRAALSFGIPPVPTLAGSAIEGDAWEEELSEQAPASTSVDFELPVPRSGEVLPEDSLKDGGGEVFSGEEFVVRADDVFAGRTEPAWRRVYPRSPVSLPRLGVWRSRFAERPLVVKAAGVLLAVWVVVALASVLAGHAGSTHRSIAVGGLGHQQATRTATVPVSRVLAHRRRARSRGVLLRRHRRPVRARPISVRSERVPPQAATLPRAAGAPAVSTPASPAPAPVREETRGGLFSP
jgi:hypothetical protein